MNKEEYLDDEIGVKEVLQSLNYLAVGKACREIKFKEEYDHIPNDKTIEILEQSKKGKGINTYKNFEEMFKKIESEINNEKT